MTVGINLTAHAHLYYFRVLNINFCCVFTCVTFAAIKARVPFLFLCNAKLGRNLLHQ